MRVTLHGSDAAALQRVGEGAPDRLHVALASHLSDETSAGLEGVPDVGDDGARARHPVQGGVGQHRVERVLEGQGLAVHDPGVYASGSGGGDHIRGGVDADHPCAGLGDTQAQAAVAAAEVENVFAGLGRQQVEQRFPQIGDESGIAFVAFGAPALAFGIVGHGELAAGALR